MDALDAFAIRLAERIAPDEVDSAPAIAHLAIAGDVSQPMTGPVFGGMFGLAEFAGTILSPVFDAITHNLPPLGSACVVGNTALRAVAYLRQKIGLSNDMAQVAPPPSQATVAVEQADTSLEAAMDRVETALRAVQNRLQAHGLDPTKAGLLAFSIIEILLTEPDGGRTVLARLGHTL